MPEFQALRSVFLGQSTEKVSPLGWFYTSPLVAVELILWEAPCKIIMNLKKYPEMNMVLGVPFEVRAPPQN